MKQTILTFLVVLMSVVTVFAQTADPLESTSFYKAYMDLDIVKQAKEQNGILTTKFMDFIIGHPDSYDLNLAIINAIGTVNAKNNYKTFMSYIANKLGYTTLDKITSKCDGNIVFCLAYIKALGMVNDVEDAIKIADIALHKDEFNEPNPSYRSINLVYHLMQAQNIINLLQYTENAGEAMVVFSDFERYNKQHIKYWCCNYDKVDINNDIRKEACNIIWDYMKQFKNSYATIRVNSRSSNPYEVYVDGDLDGIVYGNSTREIEVVPGRHHIKAVQQSGYLFSPTINHRDINCSEDEEIDVYVGFQD